MTDVIPSSCMVCRMMSKLLIHTEHLRLHAGPLLVLASVGGRFHIVGGRSCVVRRRKSQRPQTLQMGQLSIETVTPYLVFIRV